jgi:hypothetical protein
MTPKFFALYTGQPHAELMVIFANRDERARQDVDDTQAALTAAGEYVTRKESDQLTPEALPDLIVLDGVCAPLVGPVPSPGADEPSGHASIPDHRPELPNARPKSADPIHQCLRILAGQCDGARTLDGHGFNKLDADFGRSLAEARTLTPKQAAAGAKLIRKYQRQLPPDLFAQAMGAPVVGPVPSPGADEPSDEQSAPAPGPEPRAPRLQSPTAPSGQNSGQDTPAELINAKYHNKSGHAVAGNNCAEPYGDTYQNNVRPGAAKLAQFVEVLRLSGIPALYGQEEGGENTRLNDRSPIAYVKLFDPSGSWTWYLTEFSERAPDGTLNLAFGLVNGHEAELGYIDLAELANAQGRLGIGIEIDMHFRPTSLGDIRAEPDAHSN